MDRNPVQEWFERPRLGLFLHFGLYAIEGWHEQDQMRRRIPRAKYEKLIDRFNPTEWDADAVLDLAEEVGMEYVCLTAKHHDGFCLWDTQQTEFNVMRSPYGRDIIGSLAEACHKRDFPLGIYYSVVDWHHPNYPNEGRHHELEGPEPGDAPDWPAYLDFLKAQVEELCTNYGEVRHWFWDMNVPEYEDPSVNALLRSLQPNIVINNRGFDNGDFGTPEREYGHDRSCQRAEACNSVGTQSWGYREDEDYYSTSHLTQAIDAAMVRGWHYLLNVGPDPEGRVPDQAADILKEVGAWYRKVREAFDGVEFASDLVDKNHVLVTRRENTVYVHLKKPVTSDAVRLPPLSLLPSNAALLNTGECLGCSTDLLPVNWRSGKGVLRIKGLPRSILDGPETLVIRLNFDSDPAQYSASVQEFEG